MNAKELRIGNYVMSQSPYKAGNIMQVTELKEDGDEMKIQAWCVDHQLRMFGSQNEGLSPIPLTEEWLIKFGFKKREKFIYSKEEFCVAETITPWSFRRQDTHIASFRYVHQLQNLYYTLTGNELEII